MTRKNDVKEKVSELSDYLERLETIRQKCERYKTYGIDIGPEINECCELIRIVEGLLDEYRQRE